jgi:diguanylate cyclase (GGDEF)-like protein
MSTQKKGKNVDALKILVVEDSKVTMKVLCNYLTRMGITPLTAETGALAIEIYHREEPDIILLDAQLPDIDGFDVALKIRAMEKVEDWTAIIFLTSMTKDEDLERGIEVGGDDYLLKPISEVVLKAKMKAMLRLVEMQRSLVSLTAQLNDANATLKKLSATDGLTGIANRRMYDELAIREWRRCERMKKPLALVMIDVDHFKLFNDKYGHQVGDECLKAVAAQVGKFAPRATDLAARYGGEEFVMVLGETDTDGAKWIANRLRQQVSDLNIPHYATESRHVTISCGVASVVPSENCSLEILLKSADHALYQAKETGRDRVGSGTYGEIE